MELLLLEQHRQQQLALPAIALPPDIQEEEIDTSTMTKEELADFYVEDNPFYQKYFYTPNDFITNRCERVISILQETKGDELQCRNSTQVVEFLKSQEDKIKKVENYHK